MKPCECGCGEPAPVAKFNCRTTGYVKGEPLRFVNGHARRGTTQSTEARAKISAAKKGKPSGRGNPGMPCSECDEPARSKGLCQPHYDKLRRTGVLGGPLPRRDMDRLDLYLAKVDRRGPDECWPWTARRSEKNYGAFADGQGGSIAAHRFGFEALVRPLEAGEVVDHTCHNDDDSCAGGNTCEHRACQNPAHWDATDNETNGERGKSFSAVNARKVSCKWGHELTPDNSYGYKGRRQCKTCARLAARGMHPRQLAKKAAEAA